jgi:uncharacterized protein (TIGR03663 family)
MEHADEIERTTETTGWLLLLILIAAGFLRLFELGAIPLSPSEAAEAWAALGGSGAATSGLVLGINRALFWLFGAGDAAARLVPALIGTAVPVVAWLLAPVIGRRGALASAALLALSPSLVFFSRTVSGAMPGLAAAFLLLVALWRYQDEGTEHWVIVSGMALGVGLAAGATFITTALLILGASGAARPAGFRDLWRPLAGWRPWAIAAAVAVLASTTFFAYPDGLGTMAASLEAWIGGFGVGSWLRPLGLLASYELAVLVIGLVSLVYALRQGDSDQRTLAYWTLGALVLGLFRAGQPDAALSALLPLGLLAGALLDGTLRAVAEHPDDRPALLAGFVVIGILGVHIIVSLGQFAYRDSTNAANANVYLLLVGIAIILIAGVVALIWTYNGRLAGQSLLLAWVVIFGFFSWGKSWEVGHTHQNDPRQLWVEEGTSTGIRSLVQMLEATSQRATGMAHDISLTVAGDSPVLRWYLRDFAKVSWVDALRPDDVTQAVITTAEDDQPLLGDSYLGTDYPLLEEPPEPTIKTMGGSLRWLLHRQGPTPLHAGRVVLWLRQDVALISG